MVFSFLGWTVPVMRQFIPAQQRLVPVDGELAVVPVPIVRGKGVGSPDAYSQIVEAGLQAQIIEGEGHGPVSATHRAYVITIITSMVSGEHLLVRGLDCHMKRWVFHQRRCTVMQIKGDWCSRPHRSVFPLRARPRQVSDVNG